MEKIGNKKVGKFASLGITIVGGVLSFIPGLNLVGAGVLIGGGLTTGGIDLFIR